MMKGSDFHFKGQIAVFSKSVEFATTLFAFMIAA